MLAGGARARARQLWRTGLAVATVGGAGVCAVYVSNDSLQLGSSGVVRVARTAVTVAQICWDYQTQVRWRWGLPPATSSSSSLSPSEMDSDEDQAYQRLKSQVHRRSAERLLKLCSDNGGCYIKVGQHMATLDYLIPPEYVDTLKVLHSTAPQTPLVELLQVVRTELGRDPSELIEEISPEPLGTASLAQVHRARLTDGTTVALKIQHPRVRANSKIDMRTMELFVRLVAWAFPDFQLLWLAEVTKKNLPKELDFLQEADNTERVANLFSHRKWLKVPRVRRELSTGRLLVMEYMDGGHVTDRHYLAQIGVSASELSHKLNILYSEMIFGKGYIHCDPHPGNLLVRKENGVTQVVLLDHGLYLRLSDELRLGYSQFWLSILSGVAADIERSAVALGVRETYGLLACMVTGRSWTAITGGLHTRAVNSSEEDEVKNSIGRYLPEISGVLNRVPREMLLIFKTNDLLRGIGYKLGTKSSVFSLLHMSEWCTRCVYAAKYKCATSRLARVAIVAGEQWSLFKLRLYGVFLRILQTPLMRMVGGTLTSNKITS